MKRTPVIKKDGRYFLQISPKELVELEEESEEKIDNTCSHLNIRAEEHGRWGWRSKCLFCGSTTKYYNCSFLSICKLKDRMVCTEEMMEKCIKEYGPDFCQMEKK